MNKIKVKIERLGEIEIALTDEQIGELILDGAKTLKNFEKEKEDEKEWYLPNHVGSEDSEDGFTGNKINWSSYFPNISNEELDEMINQVLKREEKVKNSGKIIIPIITAGISTLIGGGPLWLMGGIIVLNVVGSFFKRPIDSAEK